MITNLASYKQMKVLLPTARAASARCACGDSMGKPSTKLLTKLQPTAYAETRTSFLGRCSRASNIGGVCFSNAQSRKDAAKYESHEVIRIIASSSYPVNFTTYTPLETPPSFSWLSTVHASVKTSLVPWPFRIPYQLTEHTEAA